MITVVNKYKEPNNTYCGRGAPLGNRFVMSNESERDAVCDKYEKWFYSIVDEVNFLEIVEKSGTDAELEASYTPISQLVYIFRKAQQGDVNLGCFCAPKRCHCDTIKHFIDNKLEAKTKQCACTGCTNKATHTWSGHPTCDDCGLPGRKIK